MALQGNPFLGKLKIPAPDLSKIPVTPFNSDALPLTETINAAVKRQQAESKTETGLVHGAKALKAAPQCLQATGEPKEAIQANIVHPALDSRELGVRQQLDKTVGSRELGVRQQLDVKINKTNAVSSALGTALDSRESGVRKIENSALDINLLVGKEKTLVILACDECKKIGSLETNYISTDELKIKISIDSNGLRNLIHRIKEKGYFSVEAKQLGRNGLRKFKIPQPVYQQFSSSALDSRESGVRQPVAQALGTALDAPPVVVVSSNYKNTTTTELAVSDEMNLIIPPGLSGLVSRRQFLQFVQEGKIEVWDLQVSLDAFAYDLKHGLIKSRSSNPVAVLIGAIKNNGGYHSLKYAEILKSEIKADLKHQDTTTNAKVEKRDPKEWDEFQAFKTENPESFKKLEEKVSKFGLNGALFEDFLFMEYKDSLKVGGEMILDPLRPAERVNS